MDEATQQGAEIESQQMEAPQGNDDAALLSAYLAHEENQDPLSHEASDPAGQADEQPAVSDDTFTVKINGQEKSVTRDELIAHYQKDHAANQKFEEAASIRREVEQQSQQQLANLQNAINHFNQTAMRWAQEGQPNWADLLENNPHEYLRQKEIFEARAVELQKAQTAQQYLNQQQQQMYNQQLQQHLATEADRLVELVPEWKDKGFREKEESQLINFLSNKGYTRQEMENLSNSKASNIQLVLNAMRYENLVNQAKAANKQVKNLPPRMERSGVPQGNRSGYDEARQRLAKTGSIDDATAAFSALFGG